MLYFQSLLGQSYIKDWDWGDIKERTLMRRFEIFGSLENNFLEWYFYFIYFI